MRRIYLLSPAHCGGRRAGLLLSEKAGFELACRLRSPGGAPLSEVFTFLSGLYFRGKVAYAGAFSSPPRGLPGALVITPGYGLRRPEEAITLSFLRRLADVPIDPADRRYRGPLLRDVGRLAASAGPECHFILLGSIATGKYLDLLTGVLGDRVRFPAEFVGRGDMSRGGLMLRCVDEGRPLRYVMLDPGDRHGRRPGRLPPRRRLAM
ncbi:MAG TPA: hypothetical protein VGR67_12245 [Candidatus Polarisedimenticolia bacterium]|jgi:hypothetical protein|nr:hypothetical protein [Candidatus Polarisedimenticolia bacterium]